MKGDIKITRDGKTRTFTKTYDGYKSYDQSRITKDRFGNYTFDDKQTGTSEVFKKTSTGFSGDKGSAAQMVDKASDNPRFNLSASVEFGAIEGMLVFIAVWASIFAPFSGGILGAGGFIVAIIATILNCCLQNKLNSWYRSFLFEWIITLALSVSFGGCYDQNCQGYGGSMCVIGMVVLLCYVPLFGYINWSFGQSYVAKFSGVATYALMFASVAKNWILVGAIIIAAAIATGIFIFIHDPTPEFEVK